MYTEFDRRTRLAELEAEFYHPKELDGIRVREPNLPRKFTTPWVWFVGPMGAISALYLMIALPATTWLRLVIWFAIGMVIYAIYGVRQSKLANPPPLPAGSGKPAATRDSAAVPPK